MTASDATPGLGELAALPGLETVTEQLAPLIAVLRAEQARRQVGITIRRPAWKNLVFTGGPGTGKSRTISVYLCASADERRGSSDRPERMRRLFCAGRRRLGLFSAPSPMTASSTGKGTQPWSDQAAWSPSHVTPRGYYRGTRRFDNARSTA